MPLTASGGQPTSRSTNKHRDDKADKEDGELQEEQYELGNEKNFLE